MWDIIAKLTLKKGVSISCILFGTLITPMWFIFQFFPKVFSLEIVKLFLVSLSIGIPVTLLGFIWLFILGTYKDVLRRHTYSFEDYVYFIASVASIQTVWLFYVPCIFVYFHPVTGTKAIRYTFSLGIGSMVGTLIYIVSSGIFKKKDSSHSTNSN